MRRNTHDPRITVRMKIAPRSEPFSYQKKKAAKLIEMKIRRRDQQGAHIHS